MGLIQNFIKNYLRCVNLFEKMANETPNIIFNKVAQFQFEPVTIF